MFRPKVLLLLIILLLSVAWLSSSGYWRAAKATWTGSNPAAHKRAVDVNEKMQLKATEAKTFVEKNNYNEAVCLKRK